MQNVFSACINKVSFVYFCMHKKIIFCKNLLKYFEKIYKYVIYLIYIAFNLKMA